MMYRIIQGIIAIPLLALLYEAPSTWKYWGIIGIDYNGVEQVGVMALLIIAICLVEQLKRNR